MLINISVLFNPIYTSGGGRMDKSPTWKFYTTWACKLLGRDIFCTPRGERTAVGSNDSWGFSCYSTPPSGRGMVIPGFYTAGRTGSSNTLLFSSVFFFFNYPAVKTGSSNTCFFLSFLVFFMVICLRPPVFTRPNKFSQQTSTIPLGLIFWVTVIYFVPCGEEEQQQSLICPWGFPLFFFCRLQTSGFLLDKQIFVTNFRYTTWVISSVFVIHFTPWGEGQRRPSLTPPGMFLVFSICN